METIEVETVEKWKIRWVRDHCSVSSESSMCTLRHESQVGLLDQWPEVREAARRCIIANRPLEDDEDRDSCGGIFKFALMREHWRLADDTFWQPINGCPYPRIREAHDRKFPKRRTLEELCGDLDDAIDTYGVNSEERESAMDTLLGEIHDRQWRPISEFVEDGQVWEFYREGGICVWVSSSYQGFATYFRKLVRPEYE